MKKIKLDQLKKSSALSRNEMREILAGTGGYGPCGWCHDQQGQILGCVDYGNPFIPCNCPGWPNYGCSAHS